MAKRITKLNQLIDQQVFDLEGKREVLGKDLSKIIDYEFKQGNGKANLVYITYRAYALGYANGKGEKV